MRYFIISLTALTKKPHKSSASLFLDFWSSLMRATWPRVKRDSSFQPVSRVVLCEKTPERNPPSVDLQALSRLCSQRTCFSKVINQCINLSKEKVQRKRPSRRPFHPPATPCLPGRVPRPGAWSFPPVSRAPAEGPLPLLVSLERRIRGTNGEGVTQDQCDLNGASPIQTQN